jgi:ATP-dependent DNA helicase RecG
MAPKITQKQLAIETGLSVRTVARELKNLRDTNVIRRVGSDRSGYWELVKK